MDKAKGIFAVFLVLLIAGYFVSKIAVFIIGPIIFNISLDCMDPVTSLIFYIVLLFELISFVLIFLVIAFDLVAKIAILSRIIPQFHLATALIVSMGYFYATQTNSPICEEFIFLAELNIGTVGFLILYLVFRNYIFKFRRRAN